MEAIIDGFFSGYDFGPIGDDAGLTYEHYENASDTAVFRAASLANFDELEPLVAAAIEMLGRSYPDCATVKYRIDRAG